jgi:hypothetical protein
MDLLHSRRFDGFCLVSSDSDFTRLASRLREEGADVYGFGARKTPESFRQACRRFIYTENLTPELDVQKSAAVTPRPTAEPAPDRALGAAVEILNRTIAQMETEDGWIGLRALGQRLANIASDFDPRTWGFRKLSDLVRQSGAFETDEADGRAMRLRPKPAAASAPKRPRRRRRAA